MGRMKDALIMIESRDPDGGTREPTKLDHDLFKLWVTETYGAKMYQSYMAGGWGQRPEV